MSVLFGLYQPEQGEIRMNSKPVEIRNPNDANDLGIGMVHQHFKLVECFTVLDNIILGVEPCSRGFLQKREARKKVPCPLPKIRSSRWIRTPWWRTSPWA